MVETPRLTIGIVSCNRLHYLRALLESIRECLPLDRIEVVVVDNASIEAGLREYVESLDFVGRKVFRKERSPSTEAVAALNTVTELTQTPLVIHLTDDVQFIARGGAWIDEVAALLLDNHQLGSVMPIALRRVSLARYFRSGFLARLFPGRYPRRHVSGGLETIEFPRWEPGTVHSALGVTRVDVWRRLGPWRSRAELASVQDAGAGAEDDMVRRLRRSGMHLRKTLFQVPVLAEIITDMRGTQGRVRGNRRYGRYMAPPDGRFYYRIRDEAEARARFAALRPAAAFEDVVEPLGFEMPLDAQGNRLKNPLGEHDEFAWIDPSVEGVELR